MLFIIFPHVYPSIMRPNSTLRAVAREKGGRRKWLWLSKWSQFPGEKTTNTKILCSIHLWWFQWSLQHPNTLSTINTSKYLFQILDRCHLLKYYYWNIDTAKKITLSFFYKFVHFCVTQFQYTLNYIYTKKWWIYNFPN